MILDLEKLITGVFLDVFKTSFGMTMKVDGQDSYLLEGEAHIAGAVGFIGDMTGVVYIYCPLSLARLLTARLAGIDEAEVDADEMVNDSVGELANRVVGGFKGKLSERDIQCVLTIPSIVRGSNFAVETVNDTERVVCAFRTETNQQVVAEMMIKTSESN
jgi:chemotaxis protein CheX